MEGSQTVLLVDDEPQVLVALEDLLSEGYTCFSARGLAVSGKEGM